MMPLTWVYAKENFWTFSLKFLSTWQYQDSRGGVFISGGIFGGLAVKMKNAWLLIVVALVGLHWKFEKIISFLIEIEDHCLCFLLEIHSLDSHGLRLVFLLFFHNHPMEPFSVNLIMAFYDVPLGILLTLLIIEWLGRKRTMALEFFVFALSIVLLFFCYSG